MVSAINILPKWKNTVYYIFHSILIDSDNGDCRITATLLRSA